MASLNQNIINFLRENGETTVDGIKGAMRNKYRSTGSDVSKAIYDLYNNRKKIEQVFLGDVPLLGYKLTESEMQKQVVEPVRQGIPVKTYPISAIAVTETPECEVQDTNEQIDVTPEFTLDRAIELIQEAFQAVKPKKIERQELKIDTLTRLAGLMSDDIKVVLEDIAADLAQ